jgi:hypothetical protein
MADTYRIVRMYREGHKPETVARGLTLQEAQGHCRNPETSSSTCTYPENIQRTKDKGPWFDGYEKE